MCIPYTVYKNGSATALTWTDSTSVIGTPGRHPGGVFRHAYSGGQFTSPGIHAYAAAVLGYAVDRLDLVVGFAQLNALVFACTVVAAELSAHDDLAAHCARARHAANGAGVHLVHLLLLSGLLRKPRLSAASLSARLVCWAGPGHLPPGLTGRSSGRQPFRVAARLAVWLGVTWLRAWRRRWLRLSRSLP